MSIRGPRLEFAVGAFLLLALATLLVLAMASTNGKLRVNGPVKIGGVNIGSVADIQVDPVKYDSVVTLAIDDRFKDLPADTTAGVFTSGLLGEAYIGLQPGGDPETLAPGEEIAFTQPAVDLLQLAGKYMFGGPSGSGHDADDASASEMEPTP